MSGTRRKYDAQFKKETVRLLVQGGRKITDLARDMGIHENVLRKWRQQYLRDSERAFPGTGHLKPEDEEIRRLKKELTDVREERDILKKALAIFSKHPK
jgi:transposase